MRVLQVRLEFQPCNLLQLGLGLLKQGFGLLQFNQLCRFNPPITDRLPFLSNPS